MFSRGACQLTLLLSYPTDQFKEERTVKSWHVGYAEPDSSLAQLFMHREGLFLSLHTPRDPVPGPVLKYWYGLDVLFPCTKCSVEGASRVIPCSVTTTYQLVEEW